VVPRDRVSITKMSEQKRQNRKSQLARAMAKGQSVAEWSRQSGVAERTAYRWAKEAKFKAAVNSHRRRAIDRSVGRLTDNLASAADAIVNLSATAQSESVRLSAIKVMFATVVAMSKFTGLEERINELEEQFHARTGSAGCVA
jgi:phosphopantetheinyl transferase (holo-ACP synthase)